MKKLIKYFMAYDCKNNQIIGYYTTMDKAIKAKRNYLKEKIEDFTIISIKTIQEEKDFPYSDKDLYKI